MAVEQYGLMNFKLHRCMQTTVAELERQLASTRAQVKNGEKEREEVRYTYLLRPAVSLALLPRSISIAIKSKVFLIRLVVPGIGALMQTLLLISVYFVHN